MKPNKVTDKQPPHSMPSFGGPVDILTLLGGQAADEARDEAFEFELLNRWQRDLPLDIEPFARVGDAYGRSARDVLAAFRRLQREGAISRVGPVLTPAAFGASTLAAISVPPDRLESVAGYISLMSEVNHNYAREHEYNLWFVLTAGERSHIDRALQRIEEATGAAPLDLPMLEGYHLDLGFDLHGPETRAARAVDLERARVSLDSRQWRLLAALEQGLPLVPRPFARLGMRADMHELEVIEQLRYWLSIGAIRRIGVVVHHHELGLRANAMCVWDVPDDDAPAIGRRIAEMPGVNLCYRRARVSKRWRYNLYCMIHGRERTAVAQIRERLIHDAGLEAHPSAVLFSTRRYKQRGARYSER
ncbi:Lrp/AsnC family transcriptional regulator [Niveibacterium umoris]|uniref:siroheme decarboxylase n=1 Tax=Niveibacterium umoris TaxID=1193620 RepID=A0A840BUW8_9RHOO|nr:Lrp/AsnC family transcriptional regulator [Niveibacterium umoris]MBB4014137.1 DNA-binding Lrp family transcriptional regulator [Niveibacterium umoris]